MFVNKGVSKIIKKYGYLPVEYLKNKDQAKENNIQRMSDKKGKKKSKKSKD
jgi:hypothetical protein